MANSRLKDYLDLYILLKNEELDKEILSDAITSTFARREMALPKNIPVGLTSEFSQDASRPPCVRIVVAFKYTTLGATE